MEIMFFGFAGLVLVSGLMYLLRRHEALLRLQSQILRTRFTLETLLRQRRELAEVWCTLCEERELLMEYIPQVRRKLVRLSHGPVSTLTPAEKEQNEAISTARLSDERQLSQLIRQSYALFLERMPESGPTRDFFQQYFHSLTRLEREIADVQELYNDLASIYNAQLRGWIGQLFRKWEHLVPRPPLPADAGETRPRRRTADENPPLASSVKL